MARRVNTAFVIGLVAVITVLVGGLAGVYYFVVAGNAQERIRQGEEYLAQGETELAIEYFKKGLAKDQTNVELMQRIGGLMAEVDADDVVDAKNTLGHVIAYAKTASAQRPDDDVLLEAYYQTFIDHARRLGSVGFYTNLFEAASAKVNATRGKNLIARKYRGIAQAHRLGSGLDDAARKTAREDLLVVLEQNPDDADAATSLAALLLFEARSLERRRAAEDELKSLRDQAVALAKRAYDNDPNDPERVLAYLRILLHPDVAQNDTAATVSASLEEKLLAAPEPRWLVLGLADLLPRIDQEVVDLDGRKVTRGLLRSQQLLHAATEAHPDVLAYHVALGRMLSLVGQSDAALEQFDAARKLGVSGNYLAVLTGQNQQAVAMLEAGGLMLAKATTTSDEAEKQAIIDEVQAMTEELSRQSGDSAGVNLLKAKLLAAQGKVRESLKYAQHATEQFEDRNPDALLLAARTAQRAGEWGTAAENYEALLRLRPSLAPLRLELAQLYVRHRQFDNAVPHLTALLEADPTNTDAQKLQIQILAASGQLDQAIERLKPLAAGGDARAAVQLAQLQVASGDKGGAGKTLERVVEAEPTNTVALQMLATVIDDTARRAELLDQAEAAGADAEQVALLRRTLVEGETLTRAELVDEQIEKREDPFERAILRFRLAQQKGEQEAADAALAEAAELKPDHPSVIELQFALALSRSNWEAAQSFADAAAESDADLAQGAFYRGRLAMAKGEYSSAAGLFREGLGIRRVFADGHRLLGDALRAMDNGAAARDAYQKALDQQPDNIEAMKGLIATAQSQGDQVEVLSLLRDLFKLRPNDAQIRNAYLQYEDQFGNPQRVLVVLTELASKAPDKTDLQRAIARQQTRLKQYGVALDTIGRVVTQEGLTLQNLAVVVAIHQSAGQVDQARAAIDSYLAQRQQAGEISSDDYRVKARFELTNGNLEQAIAIYDQAIALEDPKTRPASRDMANLLFQQGMNEQAMVRYKQLLTQFPDDAMLPLRLAEVLIRLDRMDEASEVLASVERTDQNAATLDLIAAVIARGNGDHGEALRLINSSIRANPEQALAYHHRAIEYLAQDPPALEMALTDLNKALSLQPGYLPSREVLVQIYLQQDNVDKAIDELKSLLLQVPGARPARIRLAELYLSQKENTLAWGTISEGMAMFPKDAAWPRLRAQLSGRMNRLDQAASDWQKAFELESSPQNLLGYTETLVRAGKASTALEVIQAHPSEVNQVPVLQGIRAEALAKTGQVTAAQNVFAGAIRAARSQQELSLIVNQMQRALGDSQTITQLEAIDDAGHPLAVQFSIVQLQMQAGRFEDVLAGVEKLEKALPDDAPEAFVISLARMRAMAAYAGGDYQTARAGYEQVLAARPKDLESLNNLAFMLADKLGDPAGALPLAEKAREVAPDNAQILDTLGWAQYRAGKPADAATTLRQAISQQPIAPAYLHLAVVYNELGRPDDARRYLERAVELAEQSNDTATVNEAKALLDKVE